MSSIRKDSLDIVFRKWDSDNESRTKLEGVHKGSSPLQVVIGEGGDDRALFLRTCGIGRAGKDHAGIQCPHPGGGFDKMIYYLHTEKISTWGRTKSLPSSWDDWIGWACSTSALCAICLSLPVLIGIVYSVRWGIIGSLIFPLSLRVIFNQNLWTV